MALNSLFCADVPLTNYSHSLTKSDYSDDHVTFCLHSAVAKCVVLSILCSVFVRQMTKMYNFLRCNYLYMIV